MTTIDPFATVRTFDLEAISARALALRIGERTNPGARSSSSNGHEKCERHRNR